MKCKYHRTTDYSIVGIRVGGFISDQRIPWLGHVMRRNEKETVTAVLEWKPTEKKPRARPRKIWIDTVEEDLKKK